MKNDGLLDDKTKRLVLNGIKELVTQGGYENNNGDLKEIKYHSGFWNFDFDSSDFIKQGEFLKSVKMTLKVTNWWFC